ncbi:MAG TPA: hypothetical protein PLF81_23775 [Candidatus Anammoximicrobium sp.]|nr:hypothetical protein [Candidatus Anammoximicrobium sp.]
MGPLAEAYARLGEPQQVADAAVAAYRRRSLIARHPTVAFLVFAVSPMLSLVVSCIAGVFLLMVAARGLGFIDESGQHLGTSAAAWLVYLLSAVTIVLPAAVLTAVYYGLARWAGIGSRWVLVSCLVISVLAGLTICSVSLSDMPGQSRLTYGLSVPSGWHMLQAIVPLALGVWLWRRTRSRWLGHVTAGEAISA